MTIRPKPTVLCILDGWGHSQSDDDNAIAKANTPHMDRFMRDYSTCLLDASSTHVGLPIGQMGNSEVGHTCIGAGRVVQQDLPRINSAVFSGEIDHHPVINELAQDTIASNHTVHLLGLCSEGGIHSHMDHINALLKRLAVQGVSVCIHAFLDGRDTPPKSASQYLKALQEYEARFENVKIATISGRFYAMDRDQRWDRTAKAYHAIIDANAPTFESCTQLLEEQYSKNITDEFIPPHKSAAFQGVKKSDSFLCLNFRADRVRQLLSSFVDPTFTEFPRKNLVNWSHKIGMTEYSNELNKALITLFPHEKIEHSLGEVLSHCGLKQLRVAETEKYAHVTFFLNGGREAPFEKEERIMIPSPKISTYDQQPEMSAQQVTKAVIKAIESHEFDFIVVNFANPDMVGHTGNFDATIQAIEHVDQCLGEIEAAMRPTFGAMFVTADHGNAETMIDPKSNQPHTAHTLNPVPFIYMQRDSTNKKLAHGTLADVAPTILEVMNLSQPKAMTGRSLFQSRPLDRIGIKITET